MDRHYCAHVAATEFVNAPARYEDVLSGGKKIGARLRRMEPWESAEEHKGYFAAIRAFRAEIEARLPENCTLGQARRMARSLIGAVA